MKCLQFLSIIIRKSCHNYHLKKTINIIIHTRIHNNTSMKAKQTTLQFSSEPLGCLVDSDHCSSSDTKVLLHPHFSSVYLSLFGQSTQLRKVKNIIRCKSAQINAYYLHVLKYQEFRSHTIVYSCTLIHCPTHIHTNLVVGGSCCFHQPPMGGKWQSYLVSGQHYMC